MFTVKMNISTADGRRGIEKKNVVAITEDGLYGIVLLYIRDDGSIGTFQLDLDFDRVTEIVTNDGYTTE